jgi:two-component system alkaline phosphatase synthesis response regulator PhoP
MNAHKKKILMVDDDADFVEAVSSFLEANGYQVLRAQDGREGLKLAQMEHPDLVLMDIMMKERTEGFFAVQQLRRTPGLEEVPIFVLTSLYEQVPDFRIAPEASWLAHDEFFPKPVDLETLLGRVRRCLQERAEKEAKL